MKGRLFDECGICDGCRKVELILQNVFASEHEIHIYL